MDWYNNYRLVKDGDGYILEIYLNKDLPEFADENMAKSPETSVKLEDKAKGLIKEKFSNLKINAVKFVLGAIVVATIPLYASTATAEAASPTSVSQSASKTATVTASSLNVRSGPSTSYSIIHTLWNGNRVPVVEETDGWFKIKLSDGRTGWISKTYAKISTETMGTVTATQLNVRSGPSTSYSSIHMLWNGNRVPIIDESGNWYKIRLSDGRTGWVSKTYISVDMPKQEQPKPVDTRQQKIDKVISTARSLIGTPYVYGGESPEEGGFDCSGLTQYVFKQVGYNLNRVSYDQAKQGVSVSKDNLQPGDLVFFSFNQNNKIDHVGIYTGNGKMIHSPSSGSTVKEVNINVTYWQQRYGTARRIIT
ncbi:MAG TPA: SH3 domain-containing protein [Clostridiales bacterium]|nr:SH3 domain-containing protein [Clostridiales bacterium]